MMVEDIFETPFGDIETHHDLQRALSARLEINREAPTGVDNTVEVQLAMVKYLFPDSKLLAVRAPFSSKAVRLGGGGQCLDRKGDFSFRGRIDRPDALRAELRLSSKRERVPDR